MNRTFEKIIRNRIASRAVNSIINKKNLTRNNKRRIV